MKSELFILTGLIFISTSAFGQDSLTQKSQMLDLKLQLLDSKLELLDSKIKIWEAKPKELDIKLDELDSRISSMDFDPQMINQKITEMDSLIREKSYDDRKTNVPTQIITEQEPQYFVDYKSTITLDPLKLLEGTFLLSYERILNDRLSLNLGAMSTYSTTRGLSTSYFSNQSFAYYNDRYDRYDPYEGEVMSGGGVVIQFRNYLLANYPDRRKAPIGLYAAPQFMYRKIKVTGYYREQEETEENVYEMVDKKIVQHLNVYAGGVVLGYKVPLLKVLSIDFYAGGNIRLSKYNNEDTFTKYKDWKNFDFSGVSPVAGITLGILK